MVYKFPEHPHVRKHGPVGYEDYQAYKPWLRDEFDFRCAYCLRRERFCENGADNFGADHLVPKSVDKDAENAYDNLAYVCNRCNSFRGVGLRGETLSPCEVSLAEHLRIEKDGTIVGLTPQGKEHINTLRLDSLSNTAFRRRLLGLLEDAQSVGDMKFLATLRHHFLAFPDDLPDLDNLRPKDNTRPEGKEHSYFRQKQNGTLPDTY